MVGVYTTFANFVAPLCNGCYSPAMVKKSPFGKGSVPPPGAPGGKSMIGQGGQSAVSQEVPPGALCPFIGGTSMPMINPAKAGAIMRPGANPFDAIEVGVSLMPCQKEKCHLWSSEHKACDMKLAAQAQVRAANTLEEIKASLDGREGTETG